MLAVFCGFGMLIQSKILGDRGTEIADAISSTLGGASEEKLVFLLSASTAREPNLSSSWRFHGIKNYP